VWAPHDVDSKPGSEGGQSAMAESVARGGVNVEPPHARRLTVPRARTATATDAFLPCVAG
jgi:hypothetical protein